MSSDATRAVPVLVVTVGRDAIDLACDALWRRGVGAIEERDVPGDDRRVELRTVVGADELSVALGELRARFDARVEEVDDAPADDWRAGARPIRVSDRLVIAPAWCDPIEDASDGARVVTIEPGAAFGLGDHPTTRASLELVDDRLRSIPTGRASVLDVGCGTGVIGLAALALGAAAVRAVDVSSAAVDVARSNATANGVGARIDIDRTPIDELSGSYDLVVANLLAPILVELAVDLRRLLSADGTLIVSGLLDGRAAHVIDALAPLRVVDRRSIDGWLALALAAP